MLKFVTDLFKPSAPKPPAPISSQTSMNFGTEEVTPFLIQLANNPRFVFPEGVAQLVQQDLQEMAVEETRRWKLTCDLDRQPIHLEIEAFMDDVNAPDLSFFSTLEAVQEIEQELEAFAAAKGL